jgi:hypothetical protein
MALFIREMYRLVTHPSLQEIIRAGILRWGGQLPVSTPLPVAAVHRLPRARRIHPLWRRVCPRPEKKENFSMVFAAHKDCNRN